MRGSARPVTAASSMSASESLLEKGVRFQPALDTLVQLRPKQSCEVHCVFKPAEQVTAFTRPLKLSIMGTGRQ